MTRESPDPIESNLQYREYLGAVTSMFDMLADQDEDESLSETELDEAEARVRTLFAQHRTTQSATTGESIAAIMIWQEAETWLAQKQLEGVRSPDSLSAPTHDAAAPGLTDLGYMPDVEIDGDVDRSADGTVDTAQITVRLNAATDSPVPVLIQITSSDGTIRSATVNQFGRAVVKNVPLPSSDRSLRVNFIRRLEK